MTWTENWAFSIYFSEKCCCNRFMLYKCYIYLFLSKKSFLTLLNLQEQAEWVAVPLHPRFPASLLLRHMTHGSFTLGMQKKSRIILKSTEILHSPTTLSTLSTTFSTKADQNLCARVNLPFLLPLFIPQSSPSPNSPFL